MNYKVCNIEYDNQLNTRMNKRYFPSKELQPNFDPRPISTKYTHFMLEDRKISNNVNLRKYDHYEISNTFFSGNRKAPTQGFFQNVDVESMLNNQFMALQKNDQAYYIPSTNSELYIHKSKLSNKPEKYDYYDMENKIVNNVDKCNLAPDLFNNSTRYNLSNLK